MDTDSWLNMESGEDSKSAVLSPHLIPLYGFGNSKHSKMIGGIYATEEIRRIFRLNCGCHVDEARQCGDACHFCAVHILENADPDELASLSPDQIHFLSVSCESHTNRCSEPLCSRSVCPRHSVTLAQGVTLCMEHYLAYEASQALEEEGPVRFELKRVLSSLFLVEDPRNEPSPPRQF